MIDVVVGGLIVYVLGGVGITHELYVLFFFKQKTAYEMRISDWSSDVCSSDLIDRPPNGAGEISAPGWMSLDRRAWALVPLIHFGRLIGAILQIGRASCRERVCLYV